MKTLGGVVAPGQGRPRFQRVKERTDVATYITIDSIVPPVFDVGQAPHQLVAVLRNSDGTPVPGTINYSSADPAIASIDSTGLVTPVAAGMAVMSTSSPDFPAVPPVSVSYTVTSPSAPVVTQLDLSSYAIGVNIGTPGTLAAIPRDASGQIVLNAPAVTWAETTGAGDVALGADSGDDNHTVQITGLVAGARLVQATCNGVPSLECTVTVTAATDFVDTLGQDHPGMPAGGDWMPLYARAYGSTKTTTGGPIGVRASGGGGTMGASTGDPWMKTESEFFDNNALTENLRIIIDPTVPLQKIRGHALLYGPSGAQRCCFAELKHGQTGGSSFFRATPFQTTIATRWPGAWGIGQKRRQIYKATAVKIRVDMPTINQGFSKFDFLALGSTTAALMLQIPFGGGLHLLPPWTYGPIKGIRLNPQGTKDNGITDAHVLTNGFWNNPANTCRLDQVDGGVDYELLRGDWYRIWERARTHTFNGNPSTSRDGYVILGIQKLLSTGTVGGADDVWSQIVLAAGPAGWAQLLTGFNATPETTQSYFNGIDCYLQTNLQPFWPADERWGPTANHNIISQVTFPYQIHGTGIFSLSPGAVCVPPAGASFPAGTWGALRIDANAAGALTGTWFTNLGAGYAQPSQAEIAARSNPIANHEYVGYVSVLAGPWLWTSGLDAFAGQSGGIPAAETRYRYTTGVHRAYEFVGGGEIEP